MSRLERKLIELGYEKYLDYWYHKFFKNFEIVLIPSIIHTGKIYIARVHYNLNDFLYQKQIDNLQQAFNEMQKDLEVLKDYENN